MSQTRTAWDIRTGETLCLVDGTREIRIRVVEKSGQRARLVVSAPEEVNVSKDAKPRPMLDTVKVQ